MPEECSLFVEGFRGLRVYKVRVRALKRFRGSELQKSKFRALAKRVSVSSHLDPKP